MQIFETGVIDTIIIWENLEYNRITCKMPESDVIDVIQVKPGEEKKELIDRETGVEREIIENKLLTEHILENYVACGMKLEFVTDKSSEGNQFCMGFGGLGGILRYRLDENVLEVLEYVSEDEDDFI